MVDPLPDGLAVRRALGRGLLPVPAPDPDPIDEVALLGLVAEAPGLVGARGAGGAVDDRELAVFPAAHAGDELEDVGLLFGVQLGEVFVGAHLEKISGVVTRERGVIAAVWGEVGENSP